MSNIVRSVLYTVIIGLLILIVSTISGKTTREVEMENNLSTAVEQALQDILTNGGYEINKYDIADNDEFAAEFMQCLMVHLQTDADVTVDIIEIDKEKGILSLKVTETYMHPNGNKGTLSYTRTVILDDYKTPSKYSNVTVTFMLNENTVYKKEVLQIENNCGEYIYPVLNKPSFPEDKNIKWTTKINDTGSIINFNNYKVKEDIVLYAIK